MKKILAVGVALVVIFVFLGFLPIHGEAQIYDSVIRLHVLANSDSKEDQDLKLKVRDELLLTVSELCSSISCTDIENAYTLVKENIPMITLKAEQCIAKEDGTIEGTGEAVQVSLSMFDRTAAPYKKELDGSVVRDKGKETQRASGSAVVDWKKAQNAKAFMEANQGKAIKFTVDATVNVRAWDRNANDGKGGFSTTELREQKVYKCEWV